MDRAETIVASRRVARWAKEERDALMELPTAEREILLLLVAHLNARLVEESK